VWEESLGWGNGQGYVNNKFPPSELTDEEFRAMQIRQTREMVRASFNHPCVIIQAFLNECDSSKPECKTLVDRLIETIRAERSGRLVSFACNVPRRDICHANTDLVAFNAYPGTIPATPGTPEALKAKVQREFNGVVALFRKKYPGKPIVVSESGCGGAYGCRDANASINTEDYQDEYLTDILETLWANPDVSGFAIWQMNDGRTRERYCELNCSTMYGGSVAGIFDIYRRPKKSVDTVRRFFAKRAAGDGDRRDESTPAPTGNVCRPGAFHRPEIRAHVGIPSIAVSPVNGRMWATWYNGKSRGEDLYNYVTLATSADGGRHWKEVLVADPDGAGPKRSFDPELWVAPDGRLRWSWTERLCDPTKGDPARDYGLDMGDPKTDVVKMATLSAEDEPDGPVPSVDVGRGVMMCKPTVLGNGDWLMPLAHWNEAPSACFYASTDGGRTFAYRGGATIPEAARLYDEHQVLECANGDLVVFIRSNCIGKDRRSVPLMSVSKDGGRTWGPAEPATYRHTSSRVFVRRLKSGNWLLVKNGPVDRDVGRKQLTAFLSKDEGRTWIGGLLLDERESVSYPDGQQLADGSIVVIYDRSRLGDKDILFAVFTEVDVLAGQSVSGKVRLRNVITSGNVLR